MRSCCLLKYCIASKPVTASTLLLPDDLELSDKILKGT